MFAQGSAIDTNAWQAIQHDILQPLQSGDRERFLDKVKFPFYYGAETLNRQMVEGRMDEIFTPAFCAEIADQTGYINAESNGESIRKKCQNGPPGYVSIVFFRLLRDGTWQLSGIDMYQRL
ncbi:MAG: hypothetical protein A3D92_08375 [Bacteroidetes bacterium RIFCSPHIGHO2_02_FULL_44_7]|nr:MAG: hypothetical protein A3D92_08375 [Bacteroidetes bacterium RIFCSPHIGHO2_02_FULL_44_7]